MILQSLKIMESYAASMTILAPQRAERLIPRISILLLRSYIGPFIVTFLVAMFIFEMQFVWVYLDDMMGKGLGIFVILKLLIYASARIVNMALPLAILMSSIMTMGALAENNELTAMKSAGVPLTRILRPLIIFHMLLAIGAFAFANNVWPIANLKFRTLLYGIIQQRPALNLESGVFYNGIEGISIRIMNKNVATQEIGDVLIYDHRDKSKGNRTVIRAEKGIMEQTADKRYLVMTLFNGVSYDEPVDKGKKVPDMALIESKFDKTILRLDLSSFAFQASNEEVFKNSYEMMTIAQLGRAIDSLEAQYDTTRIRMANASIEMLHIDKKPERSAYQFAKRDSLRRDTIRPVSKVTVNTSTASPAPKPELGFYFDQLNQRDRASSLNIAGEVSRRNVDSLTARFDELDGRQRFLVRHKIEWHRKFFLAIVCMVLFFIGAPLGAIIRKGGLGMPTVVALSLFIFYQLLTIAGEKMTKSMIVDAWFGMWMSTAVLLPLSIWLTYKASKEAVLLDKDNYTKWFGKITRLFKAKKKVAV